jgi:hypothetical protein
MSADQLATQGQAALESVTTNPLMRSSEARTALRASTRDFASSLHYNPHNAQAKMGYAVAHTLLGFYDLTEVLPDQLSSQVLALLTQGTTANKLDSPLAVPAALAAASLSEGTRASSVQSAQLRMASQTIPALRDALPLYADVKTAVGEGAVVQLRLYQDGRVRTIKFKKNDVALVDAFSNLTLALLYAAISFNLDMPQETPLKSLPIDANANNMFEANEYLIPPPFGNQLYHSGMQDCLQYLRYAADRAQDGALHSDHTTGTYALVDTSDAEVRKSLDRLARIAVAVTVACTTSVSTDALFDDGQVRTVDLPKMAYWTSIRGMLPSFQTDDLTAPGVWPDPTFGGIITPGIPQGVFSISYTWLEEAYQ